MDRDTPTLSLRFGTRMTENGQTYDLSAATERRRMVEDALEERTLADARSIDFRARIQSADLISP